QAIPAVRAAGEPRPAKDDFTDPVMLRRAGRPHRVSERGGSAEFREVAAGPLEQGGPQGPGQRLRHGQTAGRPRGSPERPAVAEEQYVQGFQTQSYGRVHVSLPRARNEAV